MAGLTRVTKPTVDVLIFLARPGTDDTWGLAIVKALGRPSGTVYPILERLESLGWVASEWETSHTHPGPPRRLYSLTAIGREQTERLIAAREATPSDSELRG